MEPFSLSIICTGNELLDGRVVNTNLVDISHHLQTVGLIPSRCTLVSDKFDELVFTIKREIKEQSCIIITGGLGPTDDDRTSEAVSKATGLPLKQHKDALDQITTFFSSRNRPMSENNKKQALFPKGAQVIKNSVGTAPGYMLDTQHCFIISLPGVPIEMNNMFTETLNKTLGNRFAKYSSPFWTKTWSCYGRGESSLAQAIESVYPLPNHVDILYRASHPVVHITVQCEKKHQKENTKQLNAIQSLLNKKLGPYVFSKEKETIEQATLKKLLKNNQTVSLAESCTGGLVASMLTKCPGASDVLKQGVVCYSNESKSNALGVPLNIITTHGAVSEPVAKSMAEGALKKANADIGLSITGVAGPGGGTKQKPVGTVFIGLAKKHSSTIVTKHLFHGTREIIQKKVAHEALMKLFQL